MNRRGFLGMLGAVGAVRLKADTPYEPFGYLTPDIVTARGYDNATVRVFLDGHEVKHILSCDDRAGYIELLATDWQGDHFRDEQHPDRLARERRYGRVRVTMQRRPSTVVHEFHIHRERFDPEALMREIRAQHRRDWPELYP